MKLSKNQSHALGNLKWKKSIHIVEADILADASSGFVVDVPFACTVVGMRAIPTVSNASGTVTLSDGTNDISDALDIAVVSVPDQAALLDQDYVDLKKGDTFVLTTNGAGDRAKVLIEVIPR